MMKRSVDTLLWFGLMAVAGQGVLLAQPKVISAHCGANGCRLWDQITVEFTGLNAWITTAPGNDPSKLTLALDGHLLKGINPHPHIPGSEKLEFDLNRTADNRDVWNGLLSRPGWEETMSVS